MRKIILFVLFLAISISWISYAYNEFTYNNALELANQYIKNSSYDENWKDSNPRIEDKWVEYHTDDENKVSYIEFKVVCDKEPNCWFIMVNFDWDDVAVPIASTSWNTPSEVLIAQNKNIKGIYKFYYFWLLDIYSENISTNDVFSFNSKDNVDILIEENKIFNYEEKMKVKNENKKILDERLKNLKNISKEIKKSDEFKIIIKEINKNKENIIEKKISFKVLPFANADIDNWLPSNYIFPWSADIYIQWNLTTSNCNSNIPCYDQYTTSYTPAPFPYASAICYSWCSPNAIAMLFWYYDRLGTKPNLFPWVAPDFSLRESPNLSIVNFINSIKPYIWTYCVRQGTSNVFYWSTQTNRIKDAKNYAINKWYYNTTSNYIQWNASVFFNTFKSEINNNRPSIIHIQSSDSPEWHSVVWYWYKSTGTNYVAKVNMWWGKRSVPRTNNTYWYSAYNIDLNSIFYNSSNNHSASWLTTFNIK